MPLNATTSRHGRSLLLASVLMFCGGLAHAGSTLTVNTTSDADDNNDGKLSLREAILIASGHMAHGISGPEKNQVNGGSFVRTNPLDDHSWVPVVFPLNPNVGSSYADDIVFDSGVDTIFVGGTQLPEVGQNDDINGDRGGGGKVVLNGQNNGNDGLRLNCGAATANNIRNLTIRNFGRAAIYGTAVQGGLFQGLELFSNGDGISLDWFDNGIGSGKRFNPRNNQIGGTDISQRNYIYSNSSNGIVITGNNAIEQAPYLNNHIENNYIGLKNSAGDADNGNGNNGIDLINAFGNIIGGDSEASRNVISGNNNDGIKLEGTGSNANMVVNNYIGVNAAGTAKIGNGSSGVSMISGAGENTNNFRPGNQIGDVGKPNVIGGGTYGVFIGDAGTNANHVFGNRIGVSIGGQAIPDTGAGVGIYNGAQNNVIEGSTAQPNYIIFNGQGVDLAGNATTGNIVKGNLIGGAGTPNGIGVRFWNGASNNSIGQTGTVFSNLISGNTSQGVGIYDAGTTGNKIQGNYIGLTFAGTAALGNGENGIVVQNGAANNEISGNTISGNAQQGILISGSGSNGNTLSGNRIGLNFDGTAGVANGQNGVVIAGGAQNNHVGTGVPYNIISGNVNDGVEIKDSGTTGNVVAGCAIGLNSAGTAKIQNGASGVAIFGGASNNIVGGAIGLIPVNAISGNGNLGVFISDTGTNANFVLGNVIGGNIIASAAIGNKNGGVGVFNGPSGTAVGDDGVFGNIICGNGGPGVDLAGSGTSFTSVQGNLIGTDGGGTTALPNVAGVRIYGGAHDNRIGGPNATDSNLISGNTSHGMGIYNPGSSHNLVQNNLIGLNRTGAVVLSNTGNGVLIQEGASGNTVRGNVISGNRQNGVLLNNNGTNTNIIAANRIGLLISSSVGPGNVGAGVMIADSASNNVIGGSVLADGNQIAYNAGAGVRVVLGSGNPIRMNSIYSNAALGIDLGTTSGITLNDALDADSGANLLQNYPVILGAHNVSGGLRINGELHSNANGQFTLDFYYNDTPDLTNYGEGKTYIGSLNVATDLTGLAIFTANFPAVGYISRAVSATATDAAGNTSEFSAALRNAASGWALYF